MTNDDEILNKELGLGHRKDMLRCMTFARQDVINTVRLRGFIQLADRLEKEMRK